MNIFVLDKNPRIAAEMHCDKHCVKMILETAQMLSTAHRVYDTPQAENVYKQAHLNHHKSGELIHDLSHTPHGIPELGLTPFPQAMPDKYKHEDAVEAYRAYYMGEKSKIAEWNWGTPAPDWFEINS